MADRWTLIGLLGIGGTASVYEARHRNGRRAALKVLHSEIASNPALRRRFLSEGYAANKVQHPGAVAILDEGVDSELVFLVLELLTGRSLSERLADDGPMSVPEVARIGVAVLDVLAAAHDHGVIHRDIKPSNLFETENGEIKVLDFGVAQIREEGFGSVTQSGLTLGTPAFMAPEQASGNSDEIDALTDIWAVGATLFQLLTGRLVHETSTANAAIVAAATRHVVSIRTLRPDLPEDIATTIDRALSFRRDQRWPNARSMQKAVRATLDASQVNASPSPVAVAAIAGASAAIGRRRAWALFYALGALALAAPLWLWRSVERTLPATLSVSNASGQVTQRSGARSALALPTPAPSASPSPTETNISAGAPPPPSSVKKSDKRRVPKKGPTAATPNSAAALGLDSLIETRQ